MTPDAPDSRGTHAAWWTEFDAGIIDQLLINTMELIDRTYADSDERTNAIHHLTFARYFLDDADLTTAQETPNG